jgi:hypothetical protein
MVVCSTCGSVVQRHAATCVNVGCAAHQQPLVVLERSPAVPVAVRAPMRPLRTLATTVSVAALIAGPLSAVEVVVDTNQDPAEASAAWAAWAAAELIVGAVGLAGFVAFIGWLYRARRNLEAWPDEEPTWSKGWTIGAWFVPVANVGLPGLVISEVAKLTVPAGQEDRRSRVSLLSRIWWIGWVVVLFTRFQLTDDTATHGSPIIVITVVLLLAVAAGTVLLVRAVTTEQEHRAVA